MKKQIKLLTMLIIILAYQLIITSSFAQPPQKISYQAVVRNASNVLVVKDERDAFANLGEFAARGLIVLRRAIVCGMGHMARKKYNTQSTCGNPGH